MPTVTASAERVTVLPIPLRPSDRRVSRCCGLRPMLERTGVIFKVVSDGAKFFGVDAKLDNLMHLPFLRNALRGLRQWCAAWQLVQLHRLADHDELQPLLGLLADVVLRWLLARC